MRKLHLILLSLVAAVPGGFLCFLLGKALATERTDLWKNGMTSPLGLTVVTTGLAVLVVAVVWPLLYAVAFYDDPNKGKKAEEGEAGGEDEAAADEDLETSKTPRGDSFEEEDIDVFEREGVKPSDEEADDFEEASESSEFDVDEESIDTAETADFDLGDDEFADLDLAEEEEEEAPKKKAKKKKK